MRWYADNSELKGLKTAEIPNVHLFGGIAVPQDQQLPMLEAIETSKETVFGAGRAPIKWNVRDLKRFYENHGQKDMYGRIMASVTEWRQAVFAAVDPFEFTIIIAVVEGYSSKRKVLKEVRSDLTRYVFSNGLMRFGLHVKEKEPSRAEVILDWPDGGDSEPFDVEYAWAYNRGRTKENIRYSSGSLCRLGFHDSVVFTRMTHCGLLQFADMIVGATREFVDCCIGDREPGQGVTLLRSVASKLRGHPSYVLGRGLSVNSSADELKQRLGDGLKMWILE